VKSHIGAFEVDAGWSVYVKIRLSKDERKLPERGRRRINLGGEKNRLTEEEGGGPATSLYSARPQSAENSMGPRRRGR